uniref:Transposase Tc1-like domain-containing protein n=1 Tax=Oncorhynchus tshawytscha TaxID=74940 RepID=A0AAZ3R2Q8_ONCTS
MMKQALMRTATGKEDPELLLLQRISTLELTASEIAAQINASQSSSNRHISTSGLHGRIAAKKPLLRDTNTKNRLAWAKKSKQWTLERWISVLWSDESKFEIFVSTHLVFVRRRVGERMISSCVVPTVKHGGGVIVLCSVIYLEFKAHLISMATRAFCSDTPCYLVCD